MSTTDDEYYVKYECPNCYEEYGTPEEAQECCEPEIREHFYCAKCHTKWNREEDAIRCYQECKEEEEAKTQENVIDQEMLEKRGQQRLFGNELIYDEDLQD